GIVPKLSETPGDTRWLGPALGEHTDEVLESLGYGAQARSRLREAGII
ncbi:MAG: formyl-CoA transferase, partial [Azospira oryzae]